MFEMLKQLATPAIITGLISGLYAYFQKKKEEYREYVYKNKQENFKELVVYADELVDKGITNPDLEKLLFKISQKINPYGRKIKTFGKYQWIEDDGYVWYQIEIIEDRLASKELQIEDLKELAHRIQISKRLLDIKVEKNIPLISSAKIWFYLLQYAMLLLQLFLIYSVYNRFIEQSTVFPPLLACFLIMVVSVIFLLPELSVNESDDKKSEIFFVVLLYFIVVVDAVTAYYLYYSYNFSIAFPDALSVALSVAFSVGMVSLVLIVGILISKAFVFGKSEIGKVSTIYIEEYRKLQGPKLSKRRFIDNFTVIPFFNKIQKLFHKDKREGNDDL